jgi:hypothetical protein
MGIADGNPFEGAGSAGNRTVAKIRFSDWRAML